MNNIVSELLKEIIENSKVINEAGEIETKELPAIQFPSVFINELLWGKKLAKGDSLKKEESRKFITMLGDAMKSAGADNTPIGRITALQDFLDKPADPNLSTREILANLMFLDVFSSVVNNFNAAVAGFLFEALFAGIFKGFQIEAIEGGDEDGTVDVGMEVTYRTGITNYSFKLIGPNTPIGGSFTDLVDGVSSGGEEGHVRYLVVVKDREGESKIDLIFHDFEIRADNWFDWIGHEQKGRGQEGPAKGKEIKDIAFTLDTIDQLAGKQFRCSAETGKNSWKRKENRCRINDIIRGEAALQEAAAQRSLVPREKPQWERWKDKEETPRLPPYPEEEPEETPPVAADVPEEEEGEKGDVQYRVSKPIRSRDVWIFDEKGNPLAVGDVLQPDVKYKVKEVIEKVKRTAMKTLYTDFAPGGDKEEWFSANKGVDFYTWINEKHYAKDPVFFDTLKCLSSYRKDKPDFCPRLAIVEEKKKKSSTQFEISQEHMIQYAGQRGESAQTITLDADKYLETAKGYSSVMGNHVAAIFNALKKLIDDINCYYLEEKLSERQTCAIGAMDNADSLRKNVNRYVYAVSAAAGDEAEEERMRSISATPGGGPPKFGELGQKLGRESKQPISLDKLIEQIIDKSLN